MVAFSLAALGGDGHEQAHTALLSLVERGARRSVT
jgi:hypothetical protein